MLTHVEFRSDAFPPYESEDDEVNPGRYGKRLAEYFAAELRKRGETIADIVAEDWGWIAPIDNPNFDLWLGVGNSEEYPDGFLCFIEPHNEYLRRFPQIWKRVATADRVQAIQHALDDIVRSNSQIRETKWWTYEDFNRANGSA